MKLGATERGMAKVGLQRAAELTGKSRSTIHRAMTAGRLSYEKTESGDRLVDVSELQRLFGDVRPEGVRNDAPEDRGHATRLAEARAQLELERAKNGLLAERIEELKAREGELREDRDRWRTQAEGATRLLTHQPTGMSRFSGESGSDRGWFRRLLGA
jgi:hypothetical protein